MAGASFYILMMGLVAVIAVPALITFLEGRADKRAEEETAKQLLRKRRR